jgi:autoinducer 2-degrading protein
MLCAIGDTMPKVVLKGFIIVPSEDLSAVKKALINHQDLTRNESGCLVFDVTQSENNLNRFDVYEEFIDKCAFEMHQSRVENSYWGEVSGNVERHYEIFK